MGEGFSGVAVFECRFKSKLSLQVQLQVRGNSSGSDSGSRQVFRCRFKNQDRRSLFANEGGLSNLWAGV